MAKAFIDDTNLTDIADAIRATLDESRQYLPSEMAAAIDSIPIMAQLNRKKYFQAVPAGAASGYATIEKVEGNTVAWNQLIDDTQSIGKWGSGATFTFTHTSRTYAGVCTAAGTLGYYIPIPLIPDGHKVLISVRLTSSVTSQAYNVRVSRNSGSANKFPLTANTPYQHKAIETISNGASDTATHIVFDQTTGTTASFAVNDTFEIVDLNIKDLTAIFGAGNEPTTVADFEAWLAQNIGTLPYYDYNAGELLSVKMNSVKSVGFNQWDEQWERCYWNEGAGGVKILNNNSFGCKDYINVLPNTDYYFEVPGLPHFYILQYDSNKTLITYSNYSGKRAFHTESNCHYITFYSYNSYGTTYNHDICINLSNPAKNGTYEPYHSDLADIDVTTITGINTTTNVRETIFPQGMKQADREGTAKDTLDLRSDTATVNVGSRAYQSGDESDTDVLTDGTTTYYALTTPIEYTDLQDGNGNPLNPRYKVEQGGTEQVLPVNTSTPTTVAPTLSTIYKKNA